MNRNKLMNYAGCLALTVALTSLECALIGKSAFAQSSPSAGRKQADEKERGAKGVDEKDSDASAHSRQDSSADRLFSGIYSEFHETYRLGPADEIAIRVMGQPDYTLERVKVSPAGAVYHPLLGDVEVAGMTVPQLVERLTKDLSEYLINPKVSVALIDANSAKIGVLGDVMHPGVVVMSRPMNLLEAISASGGFNDNGSKSGVTVLRQSSDGRSQTMTINVKRILEGKAKAEENIAMRAGDTVIVHGNTKKKLAYIMSLTGFGNFLYFLSR